MKVGIWGYGYVGQAVHMNLRTEPEIYDKYKNAYYNKGKMAYCDIVFICVPTPSKPDGSIDDSAIQEALEYLSFNSPEQLIVIKSTVLYSSLKKYEHLKIVFNPEFLRQNTFIQDSLNTKTVILGGDIKNTKKVKNFYENFSNIKFDYEFCTLKEACDFKYIRNVLGAYEVLFWEFVQDTTGNSRKMSELYKKFKFNDLTQVGLDGYRGFGGSCFPKDTSAWDKEHGHPLTKFMIDYNKKLQ